MPEPPRLPHRILVWAWTLDADAAAIEAAPAVLSDSEKARARSYATQELRRRFAASRARLRLLLGDHIGRDARSLVFEPNENSANRAWPPSRPCRSA